MKKYLSYILIAAFGVMAFATDTAKPKASCTPEITQAHRKAGKKAVAKKDSKNEKKSLALSESNKPAKRHHKKATKKSNSQVAPKK